MPLKLATIPYITLWARNFTQSLDFYRDKLGLEVEYEDASFAQFSTKGTKLYLHALEEAEPLRDHTVEIHFEVPEVDGAYQVLAGHGVVFEHAPQNMPWGVRMAGFRDPEGYMIEIIGPLKPGEAVASHD